MDEPQPQMGVEYGVAVFDKNEELIGKVDYIVNVAWTGEPSDFKVSSEKAKGYVLISTNNITEATPNRVKLGVTLKELKSKL